jgi:hypothetical protein
MGSLWSGHHTYQRNSFFSCLGRVRSWQSSIYREQHLGRTEHQSSIQKEKFRSIRQEPQMEAEWLGCSVHSAIRRIFKPKKWCKARIRTKSISIAHHQMAQASQSLSKRLWASFAEGGRPMVQEIQDDLRWRAGPLGNLNYSFQTNGSEWTKKVRRLLAQPIRHTPTVICLARRWKKGTTRLLSSLLFN